MVEWKDTTGVKWEDAEGRLRKVIEIFVKEQVSVKEFIGAEITKEQTFTPESKKSFNILNTGQTKPSLNNQTPSPKPPEFFDTIHFFANIQIIS